MIGSRGKDAKISEPIHNSDVDFVLVGITACWGSLFSNQASEKFNGPRQFDAKAAKPSGCCGRRRVVARPIARPGFEDLRCKSRRQFSYCEDQLSNYEAWPSETFKRGVGQLKPKKRQNVAFFKEKVVTF